MNKPLLGILNGLIRLLSKIRNRLTAPSKGSQEHVMAERARKWFSDRGDDTLRLDYELDENSVVFDIGGYKGEFVSSIFNKYGSLIYVFEPVPEYYNIIIRKFSQNRKVLSYCFGLSAKSGETRISLADNSSSLFITGNNDIDIKLKSITEFIEENKIEKIDLAKINIEGSEYDLLESLIQNGLIERFRNIQVQFHDFIIPNARTRMNAIQQELSKTHELTWQYEFIWENWKLKSSDVSS
jgi:FkbM family methyltransferase